MGGGWGKQGSGIPLSERTRVDGHRDDRGGPPPAAAPSAPPVAPVCPARHCWVSDAVDGAGVPRPGLLVEWRQAGGRWEGRVAYAVSLRAGEWAVVEEWLPAALLRPL